MIRVFLIFFISLLSVTNVFSEDVLNVKLKKGKEISDLVDLESKEIVASFYADTKEWAKIICQSFSESNQNFNKGNTFYCTD